MNKDYEKLLAEVEALAAVYIGKNAPGEQVRDTLARIESLGKIAKKIRRAQAKQADVF